jgi:hypothetical protein
MFLYALTIFTSAFLLFLVQPLIGKYILPWFGGSPGVWTTCLLFFQTVLLAGYAYAHVLTTQVKPRRQAWVHLGLLVLSLAWLPVIPDASWKPTGGEEPVARILLLLTASLGLPYLVLSATGPLLQRWFSLSHPGVPPYRLYALSNAGSLLALLGYPFLFEPLFSRTTLGWGWSAGLVVFTLLCAACAWRLRLVPESSLPEESTPADAGAAPAAADRLMWLALPAAASLLLVATTNKVCLDLAAVPFLWVLPLAIYLLSFILCFDHPRWYARGLFIPLLVVGCGGTAHFLATRSAPLPVQVATYAVTLFSACMVCHGELHRLRPAPRRLTGFYLSIAAGGAAGGLFVALLAPLLFDDYFEMQLGLVLVLYLVAMLCLLYRSRPLATGTALGALALPFVVPLLRASGESDAGGWLAACGREFLAFHAGQWPVIVVGVLVIGAALWRWRTDAWRPWVSAVPVLASVLLAVVFINQARKDGRTVFVANRNFYGTHKLHLFNDDQPLSRFYLLAHGGITHGLQFALPPQSAWPTTYYGASSGVGRALAALPGPRRVGLVGLGAGTLAAHGRAGDTFRFYEIDPSIVELAHKPFSYLKRTPAKVEIALGDARLVLEEELRQGRPQQFDLLVLDAFSSDAIPVHLLTQEAMALYLGHLRPGGIVAFHITNRNLDLSPVIEGLARHHRLQIAAISDVVETRHWWLSSTDWVLLSAERTLFEAEDVRTHLDARPDDPSALDWTDDHASLFQVLK